MNLKFINLCLTILLQLGRSRHSMGQGSGKAMPVRRCVKILKFNFPQITRSLINVELKYPWVQACLI